MNNPARSSRRAIYSGRSASPGLALGPLVVDWTDAGQPDRPERRDIGDAASEKATLEAAIAAASASLAELIDGADGDAAEILEFQLALVEDEELSAPAYAAIATGVSADLAWAEAVDILIADYRAAEEEYFRARATDLTDLRDRVLRTLSGMDDGGAELPDAAILLAEDITPSRFLSTDWTGRGIALTAGSATSHVAMLARARAVPMLVALGGVEADTGDLALLDAEAGSFILSPDNDEQASFVTGMARLGERSAADAAIACGPALTAAGQSIQVMINVADAAELDGIDPAICDGIGLARTELMFHGRNGQSGGGSGGLPGEEAQLEDYQRLLAWAGNRPVTVRTLDAGGDKPIPGYTLDNETNSFLGVRGVRLSLAHPDVFRIQIRALLRAASSGDIRIMIPMVSVPAEMDRVKAIVAGEAASLAGQGIAHRVPPVGMMVEVPAAALALESFNTDFVSIGSNDLIQYVMAASRDAPGLAELSSAAAPAVQTLISLTVDKANARDIPVSLCGDAGGDPDIVPALLAAGLTTLSVAPASVGRVKRAIAAYRGGSQ